jgi:hypothetical protein
LLLRARERKEATTTRMEVRCQAVGKMAFQERSLLRGPVTKPGNFFICIWFTRQVTPVIAANYRNPGKYIER